MADEMILVADIGGSNARFALASIQERHVSLEATSRFSTKEFPGPTEAAAAFLNAVDASPCRAVFAVAAPVIDDEIKFTNSSWVLRRRSAASFLGLERLEVINDFEALAASIGALPASSLHSLKSGAGESKSPRLVLGPGTGFGQAIIVPHTGHEVIVPTQGGHVAFAPQSDEERQVTDIIARQHPRVTVERILSGQGLVRIYSALRELAGVGPETKTAAEITQSAAVGDPAAIRACQFFWNVMGSVAGDAVLAAGARAGVFIGGGVLPKMSFIVTESDFLARFEDKGKMRRYVQDVPIKLICDDSAALYGAALRLSGVRI